MRDKTEYKEGKIYNYKTYSADGKKVLRERNVKYLFSYAESYSCLMYQHYFDKIRNKFEENSKNFFGTCIDLGKIRKGLNDKRCRFILCEEETITYTVTGREFSRKTEVTCYDKSIDRLIGTKLTKEYLNSVSDSDRYRTLYKSRVEKIGGGFTSIFIPGAMVSMPKGRKLRTSSDGFIVKKFESLTII